MVDGSHQLFGDLLPMLMLVLESFNKKSLGDQEKPFPGAQRTSKVLVTKGESLFKCMLGF
jgi:hypothetical protein